MSHLLKNRTPFVPGTRKSLIPNLIIAPCFYFSLNFFSSVACKRVHAGVYDGYIMYEYSQCIELESVEWIR